MVKKVASLMCLLLSAFNAHSMRVVSIIFDGKPESYNDRGEWHGTYMTIQTRIFFTLTIDKILNQFREHFDVHSSEQLTLFFKDKPLTENLLGGTVTEEEYSKEIFAGNGKSPFHVTVGKVQKPQGTSSDTQTNSLSGIYKIYIISEPSIGTYTPPISPIHLFGFQ